MTSIIRGNDNFDSADSPKEIQGAAAWVHFDGTGIVAIDSSYNTTSITDQGTGDYSVNFTNALSNANYAAIVAGSTILTTGDSPCIRSGSRGGTATQQTTTAVRVGYGGSGAAIDSAEMSVVCFDT